MTVQSHSKDVTINRAMLAQGCGWSVSDVAFRATSARARFEGRHEGITIVAVTAGSFRYRAAHGGVTLMPGAWLLGNAGDAFACDYEDSWGDRCVTFGYAPEYFERVAAGVTGARRTRFATHRVAATAGAIALTAHIETERGRSDADRWEELALRVAGDALAANAAPASPSARDERRVVRALDLIEARYAEALNLATIADAVHMSPYHFLRVFRAVAGVTPHQYLVRTRLRHAAVALATSDRPVADVAFEHGFGDLSTFVATFGRVFGAAPSAWRATHAGALRPRIRSRA